MDPRDPNASLLELLCPGTGNGTGCDPRWGLRGPPAPRALELWLRLLLYAAIFALSLGGNVLVVAVLVVDRRLRTVTNSFLLSLALSDLLLALSCVPFTLLSNLMGTFVFGEAVCKIVAYLMGVSVSVSTFSLVAIALERYSAICRPLQSRSWQTPSHAARVIAATWALSLLLMAPYALVSTTRRRPPAQCTHRWPSARLRQAWSLLLLLVLFLVPGVVMAVAYGLISRQLHCGLRFEMDLGAEPGASGHALSPPPPPRDNIDDGDDADDADDATSCSRRGRWRCLCRGRSLRPRCPGVGVMTSAPASRLAAKRRVVRMLVAVVAVFFLCWLPLFAANTWRAFAPAAAQRALAGTPISFIHLLSYASACANPLLYCFMNRRFRKAFAAAAARCCCCRCRRHDGRHQDGRRQRGRGDGGDDDEAGATNFSISKCSSTTVSSLGGP